MIIAVVGSRKGANLEDVTTFLTALHSSSPDAVVVSGGAAGVDKTAEQGWLALGGRVVSLRPTNIKNGNDDEWWVERWKLAPSPQTSSMEVLRDHPSFADFTSCAVYRDLLIAEYCDKLVAFQSDPPSSGTAITAGFARDLQKPVYVYSPKERFGT